MKNNSPVKYRRGQITKYDDIIYPFLRPVDAPLRAGWNLIKKYHLENIVSEKIYKSTFPLYKKFYNFLFQVKTTGMHNIPKDRAIITPNHASWLDVQILAPNLPRRTYFMAKKELLDMPIAGLFMEFTQPISIDRTNPDIRGIRMALSHLKEDRHIAIFPEGTIPGEEEMTIEDINPETGLLKGQTGAILIAIHAKAPVVPIGLIGTGLNLPPEVFPKMEKLPSIKPQPIKINVGVPIYYNEYYGKKVSKEKLTELTFILMQEIGRLAGKI